MKKEPFVEDTEQVLLNSIRYNPNVIGTHMQIIHGKINSDKKEYAQINIFSLMVLNTYLSGIDTINEKDYNDLFNKLVDIANKNTKGIEFNTDNSYKLNDVILFDKKAYLVVDAINMNNTTYLYLINNNDFEQDLSITKIKNNNGVIEYTQIEEDNEFDLVLDKIFLDFKDDILNLIVE